NANATNFLSLSTLYYEKGDLGLARLNVERALLLKPRDKTILAFKERLTERIASDFVEIKPSTFIPSVRGLRNALNPLGWFILDTICLILRFVRFAYVYRLRLPGGKFFSTTTAFSFLGLLFFISAGMGLSRQFDIANAKSLVALKPGKMHISASALSPEGKPFKAGDMFKVVETQGEWLKVSTSELEEYWLQSSEVAWVKW